MLWTLPGARCISVILVAALVSVSCTSLRLVRPSDIEGSLKQGDTVKIVTKDGRTPEFEIVSITPDTILGKDQRVDIADITRMEKREIDTGKTAGLVAGIVAGVLAIILMMAAAAAAGQAALASQI